MGDFDGTIYRCEDCKYWFNRPDLIDAGDCRFSAPIISENGQRWPTTKSTDACALFGDNNKENNSKVLFSFFCEKLGIDIPVGISAAYIYNFFGQNNNKYPLFTASVLTNYNISISEEKKQAAYNHYRNSGCILQEFNNLEDIYLSYIFEISALEMAKNSINPFLVKIPNKIFDISKKSCYRNINIYDYRIIKYLTSLSDDSEITDTDNILFLIQHIHFISIYENHRQIFY